VKDKTVRFAPNQSSRQVSPQLRHRESRSDRQRRKANERQIFSKKLELARATIAEFNHLIPKNFTSAPSSITLSKPKESTFIQYGNAMRAFAKWRGVSQRFRTIDALDCALVSFYEEEFKRGKSAGQPNSALAGFELLFPDTKGFFPTATKTSKDFTRISPPESNEGIPAFLVGHLIHDECIEGRYEIAEIAATLFDTLIRSHELQKITTEAYVATDPTEGVQSLGLISFPHDPTKNLATKSRVAQHIRITSKGLQQLLSSKKTQALAEKRLTLFSTTMAQFRYRLNLFLTRYNADHFKIGIHSFRHAGAAYLDMNNVPRQTIKDIGRWGADESMHVYLAQVGRLYNKVQEAFPHDLRAQGNKYFVSRYELIRKFRATRV